MSNNPITVACTIHAPIQKVWEYWTKPEHITHWAFASDDWEAPAAENDVRVGGRFKTRMQSKMDAKQGFDFTGTYTDVVEHSLIEYDMEKAPEEQKPRHVKVVFETIPEGTKVSTTFDPEQENTEDKQREGWQAIQDNFKKYVESNQ